MPIIRSAKKRVRTIEKKTNRNRIQKSRMKTAIKRFIQSARDGNKEVASQELIQAQKIIDQTAAKNVIHKNNASRKKTRLARIYNQLA